MKRKKIVKRQNRTDLVSIRRVRTKIAAESIRKEIEQRPLDANQHIVSIKESLNEAVSEVCKTLRTRKIKKIKTIKNSKTVREIDVNSTDLNVVKRQINQALKTNSRRQVEREGVYAIIESPSEITIEMKSIPTIPRPKKEEKNKL